MTIKTIAMAIDMTLALIVSSQAKTHHYRQSPQKNLNQITQFCGDRICGYVETVSKHNKHYRKVVKWTRVKRVSHKGYTYKKSVKVTKIVEHQGSGSSLLDKAESYLGTNPTGWSRLWCARFIAVVAPDVASRLKRMGGNPNWARDYARLPGARHHGEAGDIVVLSRGKGGHIGFVKGFDSRGNPIVISGNHNRRVGEGVYSKARVLAYVPI
jgi:uncharacterized protein (TIGR02594 family)